MQRKRYQSVLVLPHRRVPRETNIFNAYPAPFPWAMDALVRRWSVVIRRWSHHKGSYSMVITTMQDVYHAGEREVQSRAGVQASADRVGRGIKDRISESMQDFLPTLPIIIVASSNAQGTDVWASILAGPPGFIRARDERSITIAAVPLPDDPLSTNRATHPSVGLLAIDFATRRRIRLNGNVHQQPDGILVITAAQVYANCPKYIQARQVHAAPHPTDHPPMYSRVDHLTNAQQHWIRQADTFFIASTHPAHGADASHRGGNPGFVQVTDAATLVWPDYAGNSMFNTLGNIAVHPHAGLLFIDFATGSTLQLTGNAAIIWDDAQVRQHAGAERLLIYHITQVLETRSALPLRWHFESASPFNPPLTPEARNDQ